MEFLCKFCGKREDEPQGWLVAFELTTPGRDVRNTIFLADRWDGSTALQEGALHLCSQRCQEEYLITWREQSAA
ncbi:MAG TPA: hypothetical protein VJX16_22680 [Terriglobales bacterium]|nr:hypothetical protein [Terriglobales bacterium]